MGQYVVWRHIEPAVGHRTVDVPAVHQAAGRAADPEGIQAISAYAHEYHRKTPDSLLLTG